MKPNPSLWCFALALLFLTSCQSLRERRELRSIYIEEFKLTYFETLLQKAFHHPEFQKATASDRSHFSEPILTESSRALIAQYTTLHAAQIQQDSIQSIGHRAEGSQGKRVWAFALKQYKSKWLEGLARSEGEKFCRLNRTN
ncbi:MAG: hypothetical protein U0X58_07460 [Flavobacteriaceae bacterium]